MYLNGNNECLLYGYIPNKVEANFGNDQNEFFLVFILIKIK